MSYTAKQINETVSFIVEDGFSYLNSSTKAHIRHGLRQLLDSLVKASPKEDKFSIDPRKPYLFREFFGYLKANQIEFPSNTQYVLKINGTSTKVCDHKLTAIYRLSKSTEHRQKNDSQDAIKCGLHDFKVERSGKYDWLYEEEQSDSENEQSLSEEEQSGSEKEWLRWSEEEQSLSEEEQSLSEEEQSWDEEEQSFSEEDSDSDSMDTSVSEYDDYKWRAEQQFEHSNRSKSSRPLYLSAKNESIEKQSETSKNAASKTAKTWLYDRRRADVEKRFVPEKPLIDMNRDRVQRGHSRKARKCES